MAAAKKTTPAINEKTALKLVTEMIAIPGKSCEEGKIAAYIRKKLVAAGVPTASIVHDTAHKKSPLGGEIGNMIVKIPGTVRGPRRLLMGHTDTVPLCEGARPVRKGQFIVSKDAHTALGGDDRAGAAVVLNAILEIRRQKLPHPPLTLFWPIQEEVGLYGARLATLSKLGAPKLCFNWDGSATNLATIGATGDYAINIEIDGIASHAGGHPERGVNAIAIAGLAISDLVENAWHGLIVKGKNAGTSNIGIIHAGSANATNVVVNHLKLKAEARSHDPKFRKKIVEAFRKAFTKAAAQVKNDSGKKGRVRFQADLKYESFRLSEKEPVVKMALSAIDSVGLPAQTAISNGGLDANWLTAHGLPTVTIGCGQRDAHTVDESLHVESFLNACRTGLLLATGQEAAGKKS
ncbi:MAG: M20/M25/M40 family metallo-hydrolase [Planctomycetaceae bacterium]|nr:M20/M25/M40 family metallo-hydrolase [Planctomycetaceae bacterium]